MSNGYNLGRIGLRICGEYNAASNYSELDVVSYNGSSYVAKTAAPAGTLPNDEDYWALLALGEETPNPDYSTDEQDTGRKWIDGKSIYRRVLVIPVTATGASYPTVPATNADTWWIDESAAFLVAEGGRIYGNHASSNSGTLYFRVDLYAAGATALTMYSAYNGTAYICLMYTKA